MLRPSKGRRRFRPDQKSPRPRPRWCPCHVLSCPVMLCHATSRFAVAVPRSRRSLELTGAGRPRGRVAVPAYACCCVVCDFSLPPAQRERAGGEEEWAASRRTGQQSHTIGWGHRINCRPLNDSGCSRTGGGIRRGWYCAQSPLRGAEFWTALRWVGCVDIALYSSGPALPIRRFVDRSSS